MRLFAERGFRATSVGDIEGAVGLVPRRGALYKHFPSKQALLEAAVRAHLDSAAAGATEIGALEKVGALAPTPSCCDRSSTASAGGSSPRWTASRT